MQIKNVRFIIAAITTLSAYAVYVSRVNLSIAIIAMVDDGHQHATGDAAIADHRESGGGGGGRHDLAPPLNSSSSTAIRTTTTTTPTSPNSSTAPTWLQHPNQTSANQLQEPRQGAFAGIFPASKRTLMKVPLISQQKFDWDQTEQGNILGAFFLGYILFQIPGARMAELVGARWILIAATAGSALISLVFPLSTQLNSIHLLMVLRFAMGLCQSAFFPAAYVFFCRWLPEAERSVLLPIMFIGSNLGSISTYIMSSYLISSAYGWPSVFYVSGLICLIVTLFWFVFGSNGPQDNWLITKEERDYILENVDNGSTQQLQQQQQQQQQRPETILNNKGQQAMNRHSEFEPNRCEILPPRRGSINRSKSANDLNPNRATLTSYHPEVIMLETGTNSMKHQQQVCATDNSNSNSNSNNNHNYNHNQKHNHKHKHQAEGQRLDWCKLLTSLPVWVLIFSMYGNEWSQVVLTYELPTYLNKALDIPIEQNGVINSFFQLSYTIASPILSSLGAYMLDKHLFGMRKIHVRKLFQSLATFGQLACYASVPICGANRGLIIMFMFSAIVFKACANAGDIMVSGDLSPDFAGTIFAVANSVGNTAGFFVPILAGVIVEDQFKRDKWTPFWVTSALIMACSGLIFLVFGETRRQNYSVDEEEDEEEEDDDDDDDDVATINSARSPNGHTVDMKRAPGPALVH